MLIVVHQGLEVLPKLNLYQGNMSMIDFQDIMICLKDLIMSFVLEPILFIKNIIMYNSY